jgi:hypothetical protein
VYGSCLQDGKIRHDDVTNMIHENE